MCLHNILFPVFMFAFISHCRFEFFFLRNSSPLFSKTRSSSISVIHISVKIHVKNNAKKDTTLLSFFFLKVRAAM